jgi:hypothetical protein
VGAKVFSIFITAAMAHYMRISTVIGVIVMNNAKDSMGN